MKFINLQKNKDNKKDYLSSDRSLQQNKRQISLRGFLERRKWPPNLKSYSKKEYQQFYKTAEHIESLAYFKKITVSHAKNE